MNEERLARFLEQNERKHWGKYRAFVIDRNDPEQLGRLKLKVPSILRDAITGWAWPAVPYAGANVGFLFLPEVGDMVWVEFADGELDQPIWTGASWGMPQGNAEIPEDAKANYPDTHVLRTKSGHTIILEDKAGQEMLTVRAKSGCEITLDPNTSQITVKAEKVVVQNSGQQLQELATKAFVKEVFETHTHGSGTGPTSKPLPSVPTTLPELTSVFRAE